MPRTQPAGEYLAVHARLIESQSRLRESLRLQRESLESRQARISHAITLIKTAECSLDEGQDLSLDDLATLTREIVVQQPISITGFQSRFVARVAERAPAGEASRALEQVREEARRLKDTGDIDAEPPKQIVQRLRSLVRTVALPLRAHEGVIRGALNQTLADAQANSKHCPSIQLRSTSSSKSPRE